MAETGLSFAEIFTVFFYYYSLSLSTLIVFIKQLLPQRRCIRKKSGSCMEPKQYDGRSRN